VYYLHPFTLHELELLRGVYEPRSRHHEPRRRRSPWRARIRAMLREHPQLDIFTVDAEEITGQLAHEGGR
jgi:hypothetical protein